MVDLGRSGVLALGEWDFSGTRNPEPKRALRGGADTEDNRGLADPQHAVTAIELGATAAGPSTGGTTGGGFSGCGSSGGGDTVVEVFCATRGPLAEVVKGWKRFAGPKGRLMPEVDGAFTSCGARKPLAAERALKGADDTPAGSTATEPFSK